MVHQDFLNSIIEKIKSDDSAIGLAVGGSWITNEIDEFSDLDLILVTSQKIAPNFDRMNNYAQKFGNLLNAFTGEHVGEPRLLICLFNNPLLHVDIKFLTTDEFYQRIENPVIVWERDNILSNIVKSTTFQFPYPDFQWIEDRFWIWIHYTCQKIGRGELFEALEATSFLRVNVISSLMQIRNKQLPRALRKLEKNLIKQDLEVLKNTVAGYNRNSIIKSLTNIINLYLELRQDLFISKIVLRSETEKAVIKYFEKLQS